MTEYQCVAFVCQVATENFPLPDDARVTAEIRDRARNDLQRVVRNALVPFGTSKVRERQLVTTRLLFDGRLEGLTALGSLERQPASGVRVSFSWVPAIDDPEVLIDLGLALMLDESRPQFSRIKRCALESCGMYFVQINIGSGRPTHFCCLDHGNRQRSIDSTLRKRRERARLKK